MSYRLVMSAYCGMRIPHIEEGELASCRAMAARLIRRHRNRLQYPVTIMERGHSWELQGDPEGASMIGDSEGVLVICENEEEPDRWLCTTCMETHDSQEDAEQCCTGPDEFDDDEEEDD